MAAQSWNGAIRGAGLFSSNVRWLASLILGIVFLFALAATCIMTNVKAGSVTRSMRVNMKRIDAAKELRAKLEVEKARLVATHELQSKAGALGFSEPAPKQVRRMQLGSRP